MLMVGLNYVQLMSQLKTTNSDRAEYSQGIGYVANVEALQSEEVAAAILYAVTQPARVNVNEIMLRPLKQEC